MNVIRLIPKAPLILVVPLILGCAEGEDAKVAQVAREGAQRQAEQSRQMAQMQTEIAAGAKQLVEADAKARGELIAAQQGLHTQQAEIGHQRDNLELARKEVAQQRQSESLLAPILQGLGILVFGAFVIGLCWCILHRPKSDADASTELSELLVIELATGSPKLLPAIASGDLTGRGFDGPALPMPPADTKT